MLKKWAVLISGRGSNLAAILDVRTEADIRLVVSSASQAHGLLRARRAGIPTALTPFVPGTKRIDWLALDALLRSRGITHVFLAGFMKVLPPSFVALWAGRILNLHPSLLPSFPGLDGIGRAYRDAADIGVTVHEVTAEVDAGKIVGQRRCLNGHDVHGYALDVVEFLVHVNEQRVVKEAVSRWNRTVML